MSVMAEAQRLARAGRRGEAVAFVQRSADAGDVEALLALATWRLYGIGVPRDAAAVHPLLARAAGSGSAEAARMQAILIGNGTGCEADPERARAILETIADQDPRVARQLEALDAMAPRQPSAETQSEDPPIRMLRGLFSEDECRYVMELAAPVLRPSAIVDPRTGIPKPHPFRTSDGTNFGPAEEDLVLHGLNRRIAEASGTDVCCGEPLHILRYSPGQEYRPHFDALPGVANQRRWTALVYLNEGYEGGETEFPELGIAAKGKTGDALLFRNVTEDGAGDPRTRHAGRPVVKGVKWLATRWIRERAFNPFLPG